MSKVECIDCAALPGPLTDPSPGEEELYPGLRPVKPRPIHPDSGPRKPRCATHHRTALAAVCVDCRAGEDPLKRPRRIDPRSAPDQPRCATHYRAELRSRTTCVDCREAAEPPPEPRPIDPRSGPRTPRCATHHRAAKLARKVKAHGTYVQKTYGLSEDEYWEIYEAQGRKCAFPRCRATGKVKRLAVDHDRDMAVNVCGHERDRGCRNCARGLLCGPHNFDLMGKFALDLEDALDYRKNPPARKVLDGGGA